MNPLLSRKLGIASAEAVSGGCVHACYRVSIQGSTRFLKVNKAVFGDSFAAEADGLQALRDNYASSGIKVPQPLAHGEAGGEAYLLLEYLQLERRGDPAVLGRMLARAHLLPGPRFGWHRDNYIGATPQQNGWNDDWAAFWERRRLGPQLELARRNGHDVGSVDVHRLAKKHLHDHRPQPSLLHGDLWSGNAGSTADGPALFDPAVYYGDREADLAMTELFGGFPRAFYAAYEAEFPLEPGYEKRKHLYNLYHLLNHLNLFGGGYLGQVQATLRLLLG